jgi:hypothetical protein
MTDEPSIKHIPKPLLESTRVVIVLGATFPSFRPPNAPYIEPIKPPRGEEGKPGQWFHIIPSPPPEDGFPHAKHFAVRHQVMVGTIDEIVARFRDQLEKSFAMLYQTGELPEDAEDNMKEDQASMWACTADMQNILNHAFRDQDEGMAVMLPWIDKTHPAYKDWQAAKEVYRIKTRREAAKVFNAELFMQLKSKDNETQKNAVDQIHAYLMVALDESKVNREDVGVEVVSRDPIHLKMFGIEIKEEDFQKEIDVRDQWRTRMGVGLVGNVNNPADLYLIDVDTE